MTFATLFILFVSCVMMAHSSHLRGVFGEQQFTLDVEFDGDTMEVIMHRPLNAPDNFRETTNLHFFPKHLVAMRNSQDRQCYVRYFIESVDLMKGRVENAEYNNGMMGNLTEELLNVEGISTLSPRTVKFLMGDEISEFCHGHDVFLVDVRDYTIQNPEDVKLQTRRQKRQASGIVVAGSCGCCCWNKV